MGGIGWGKRGAPKVVLTARVEESDRRALDRLAHLTGRTIGEVIREACRLYILSQERAIGRAEKEWEEENSHSIPDSSS